MAQSVPLGTTFLPLVLLTVDRSLALGPFEEPKHELKNFFC